VSVNGVDADVWKEGQCRSQCSYGERLFMIEELLTGVIARHRRTLT
jgi:hypothetical protein